MTASAPPPRYRPEPTPALVSSLIPETGAGVRRSHQQTAAAYFVATVPGTPSGRLTIGVR